VDPSCPLKVPLANRAGYAPVPRYALAPVLLFGSYHLVWGFAVFPLWVLLISTYIFLDNTRTHASSIGSNR